MDSAAPLYCVDMGTTRTRVWLVEGDRIWSFAAENFGVRDVAFGGDRQILSDGLRRLLSRAAADALSTGLPAQPTCIAAAGMITSPLGLLHLPHIDAPAGAKELAGSIQRAHFDCNRILPLYLVPGVATGEAKGGVDGILSSDLMRGEETLCIGLLVAGRVAANSAVLNLGSHWKWISIDRQARIARSRTSLAGEMIHAVQTQTLLASALPQERPGTLDPEWLERGSKEAERSGLSRTLFGVRLLEQGGTTTPEERLAFLYGAFIEVEIQALVRDNLLPGAGSVCLVGAPSLAEAWHRRLVAGGVSAHVLPEQQRDLAYLSSLQHLLRHHID